MLHELNSDRETVMLRCAEAIAEYVHFGQKDKQGRPYIEHVMRVARACKRLTIEQRVAAVLHDVYEDASEKINGYAVKGLFGEKTHILVLALTRKRNCPYNYYVDDIIRRPLAIPIKLADLADNLDPTRGPISDSLRERYEKAAVKLLDAYAEACEKACENGTPEEKAILAKAF